MSPAAYEDELGREFLSRVVDYVHNQVAHQAASIKLIASQSDSDDPALVSIVPISSTACPCVFMVSSETVADCVVGRYRTHLELGGYRDKRELFQDVEELLWSVLTGSYTEDVLIGPTGKLFEAKGRFNLRGGRVRTFLYVADTDRPDVGSRWQRVIYTPYGA